MVVSIRLEFFLLINLYNKNPPINIVIVAKQEIIIIRVLSFLDSLISFKISIISPKTFSLNLSLSLSFSNKRLLDDSDTEEEE